MVEKRNNEITNENEDIEYNNWYIIMYKDQLLFNKPKNNIDNKEIELEITENEINKKIESEITENEINKNIENEINKENEIVNENSSKFEINNDEIKEKVKMEWEKIKNTNKITIKILKELLLKLDLKVSGKKDEMQKRLENRLNNSLF
jgi:hypothetical protein